jgi:hypothetical protein
MSLFAKPVVTWKQPKAFWLNQVRLLPWWVRPSVVAIFVALVLLFREGNKLIPSREHIDLITALARGFGFGFFVVYFLPWVCGLARHDIFLYSSGIQRIGQQTKLPFKDMGGFIWTEEGSYYVLHLITKKGRTLSYGVPDPMTRDKIEAVLDQSGLSKISTLVKPDFEATRKAIWGQRVFTTEEVEAMREEEKNP